MRRAIAQALYLSPLALALGAVLVAACATPKPPAPQPVVTTVCLPMADYSPAVENQIAAEIPQLKPDDPLRLFVADYGRMRAANRKACTPPPNPGATP